MLAVVSFPAVWGFACLSPLVAISVAGFFYARHCRVFVVGPLAASLALISIASLLINECGFYRLASRCPTSRNWPPREKNRFAAWRCCYCEYRF
jgi:hypothetical protein